MPSHPPYALISLTSVETNILSFNIIYFFICLFLFIRFLGSSNYIRIRDLLVFFEIEVTLSRKNLFSFSTVLGLTYALLHTSLVFFSLSSFSIVQFSRYIFWVKKNLISSSAALRCLVEMRRIELLTPCLQGRCSPSWATPPKFVWYFVTSGLPYTCTVCAFVPRLKQIYSVSDQMIKIGGPKWTRTTDLTLIRRAL